MSVKVSVIMSVYNPHPFSHLEKAVESIRDQTWKDWELLIYNDGSDAEYGKKIRELAEGDPRIPVSGGQNQPGDRFRAQPVYPCGGRRVHCPDGRR